MKKRPEGGKHERKKSAGKKRRNARNSLWRSGTGNRKCRWRARVYPERGNEVVFSLYAL